jgi:hypothetical protein
MNYPNALNISRHNWAEEKKFFNEQISFDTDVQLIKFLTKPQERVALIGSFAAKMLMDSARQPFFYYSPVIVSSLNSVNEFRGTALISKERLEKTLIELEAQRPSLVFVEKKLFMLSVPRDYEGYIQDWIVLKDYLANRYDTSGEGKYLMVLKRKSQ